MSANPTDALIVGGGLIGCTIARALAEDGLTVTVVERAQVGREASYAAAGMLAPHAEASAGGPFLDLCLESRAMYPALAEELFAETGTDVWYRDEGTFLVALGDSEAEQLRAKAARSAALGLESELLGAAVARRAEPALSPEVTAVLSVPGDHQVDNRRLVDAVALSCYTRGVRVVENTPARSLVRDGAGRVVGVDTTAGRFDAGTVIVAAGCWSNLVGDFPVPVEPVKGQMLMLEMSSPPFRRVLRSERCYVVARIDGRVLVGATTERVGYDKTVSSTSVGVLLEAARELAPALGGALGGEAWAGLRPATPDSLPAVGTVCDGLIAATGHFRNGILLAPVTARIVSGILRGDAPHAASALLDPRRFSAGAAAEAPRGDATGEA